MTGTSQQSAHGAPSRWKIGWIGRMFASLRAHWQLRSLTTAHQTSIFFSPGNRQLLHGQKSEALDELLLLILDCDHAFFIKRTGGGGNWTLVPTATVLRTDPNRITCAITQPITGQYYSAAPLQSGSSYAPLLANRSVRGTWETFSLSPIEFPVALARWRMCKDLRRIVRKRPDLRTALRWAARKRPPFPNEVLKAYLFASLDRSDLLATSFSGFEVSLAKLSSPDDPWMWKGLRDLSRWQRDRNRLPQQETLGPDLDCVGAAYISPPTVGRIWCSAKRLAIVPQRKACVIASARNEGPYLIEWIAHHRAIGFEHIFLYSNNNDDHSDELLSALASNGVITWFNNVGGHAQIPQHKAYGHALGILPHTLNYEWALILDLDEFWMCDTTRFPTVSDYLAWQETQDVQAITFNWCMFGTYGAQRFSPDALVTRRFLRRHEQVHSAVKTMFKPRFFDHAHVHYPFHSAGVNVLFRDSEARIYRHEEEFAFGAEPSAVSAWINHYYSKSIDDILWRGMRRGGDQPLQSPPEPLDAARAALSRLLGLESGVNSVIDRRALDCVPDLQTRVNEILDMPGVRRAAHTVNDAVRARISDIHKAIKAESAGSEAWVQLLRQLVFEDASIASPGAPQSS
jgi:hypothetical protein